MDNVCPVCGYSYPNGMNYCPGECSSKSVCKTCLSVFVPDTKANWEKDYLGKDYCSIVCRDISRSRHRNKLPECEQCGKVLPRYHRPTSMYSGAYVAHLCSKECHERYSDANPPNWQAWKD